METMQVRTSCNHVVQFALYPVTSKTNFEVEYAENVMNCNCNHWKLNVTSLF